jgi:predicted MFS family arabinose efflux permease
MFDMSNREPVQGVVGATLPFGISRRMTLLMAVTVGMLVANLHYMPPLLSVVAADLGLTEGQVGTAATLAVVAQTFAMLFVLPLGDICERRKLILASLAASIVALLVVAASHSFFWLATSMAAVGLATTGTHMTVSLAASLAPAAQRGRVVGTVISGLLVGILTARIFGGVVGAYVGWRLVYVAAAALLVVLLTVLWSTLPATRATAQISYGALLGSMWTLWRTERVIRETCFFGAMTFGAFSAFWMTLAFHLERLPQHYGSQVVGLMGLFAIAGALAAAGAGRLADRFGAREMSGAFLLLTAASFGILGLAGHTLWGIGLGVVLMDLGIQAVHVCNQTRVYALRPEARNRVGAIYIVTYFAGGSVGSALGTWAWTHAAWPGVCGVGAGLVFLAVLRFGAGRRAGGDASRRFVPREPRLAEA